MRGDRRLLEAAMELIERRIDSIVAQAVRMGADTFIECKPITHQWLQDAERLRAEVRQLREHPTEGL